MTEAIGNALAWLEGREAEMVALLGQWCAINSASEHVAGLARQAAVLEEAFMPLGRMERVALPKREYVDDEGKRVSQELGQVLHLVHEGAGVNTNARRVLLNIHYDTVHGAGSGFDEAVVDGALMRGPGVVDAKGGIVVMLYALLALQHAGLEERLRYEVVLNPDEEIGSPGSAGFLQERASACDVGLVFEPALPDGSMVLGRGGSGNFTLVVRGRSAHAGRNFAAGRNAVAALARAMVDLDELNGRWEGVTVNVARCVGGGAANVVPAVAVCRFNVRYGSLEVEREVGQAVDEIVRKLNAREGIEAELAGGFYARPKIVDAGIRGLADLITESGQALGIKLNWRDTGGVSDGNRLAAAGLANVDTLGPCGGGLHSHEEYVLTRSLVERAKLAAMVMDRLGASEG